MKRNVLFLLTALLVALSSETNAQTQAQIDSGFDWISLEEAQVKAEETGKKILLFGYAEWCTYCLKTRKETFPDSTVLSSINEFFIPVQLDAESQDEIMYNGKKMPEYQLARYLRLSSYPTHFFIDSKGEILGAQPGFIEPFVYGPLLNYVGTDAYKNMGFEEFFEGSEGENDQ
jgi:thioredoxin-related protein